MTPNPRPFPDLLRSAALEAKFASSARLPCGRSIGERCAILQRAAGTDAQPDLDRA